MTAVNPEHAAEIKKAFSDYDEMIYSEPRHPTRTTRGSLWVTHADGTSTHWQIRRPMSMHEARRACRLEVVESGRKVQAGFWLRAYSRARSFLRGNTIFTDSPLRPGNSVNNAFSSVGITELMLPELPLLATVPS